MLALSNLFSVFPLFLFFWLFVDALPCPFGPCLYIAFVWLVVFSFLYYIRLFFLSVCVFPLFLFSLSFSNMYVAIEERLEGEGRGGRDQVKHQTSAQDNKNYPLSFFHSTSHSPLSCSSAVCLSFPVFLSCSYIISFSLLRHLPPPVLFSSLPFFIKYP